MAKKFKPGNMWSSDFDYDGMLDYGKKIDGKTSDKQLEKYADSMEDVNYHTLAKPLFDYQVATSGDKERIKKYYLRQFKRGLSDQLAESGEERLSFDDIYKYKNGGMTMYDTPDAKIGEVKFSMAKNQDFDIEVPEGKYRLLRSKPFDIPSEIIDMNRGNKFEKLSVNDSPIAHKYQKEIQEFYNQDKSRFAKGGKIKEAIDFIKDDDKTKRSKKDFKWYLSGILDKKGENKTINEAIDYMKFDDRTKVSKADFKTYLLEILERERDYAKGGTLQPKDEGVFALFRNSRETEDNSLPMISVMVGGKWKNVATDDVQAIYNVDGKGDDFEYYVNLEGVDVIEKGEDYEFTFANDEAQNKAYPKRITMFRIYRDDYAEGGEIEDMSYEELMDVVFEENSSNQNEKLAKEIAKIQGFKYDAVEYADFHLVVRDYLDKSTNKNDDESREVLLQAFENTGIEYDDDDEYAKGGEIAYNVDKGDWYFEDKRKGIYRGGFESFEDAYEKIYNKTPYAKGGSKMAKVGSTYAKGGQAPDDYTGESRVLGYVAVLTDMKSSYYKDMPKKGDILPFTKENCDRYDVCHSVIAWYKGRGNEYSLKDEMRGFYDGEVEYTGRYFAKGGSIGSGAYVLRLFEDAHDKVREDGFDDMDAYTEDLNERGLGYAEYDEGKYGGEEGFYTHDNDIVEELVSDGIAFKTYSGNYAKGGMIPFSSSNLYFNSFGKDSNGNSVIKVSFPNSRAFSIQTNGDLPKTHSLKQQYSKIENLSDKDLKIVEKEVTDYVKEFGSDTQIKKLNTYAKGGKVSKYKTGITKYGKNQYAVRVDIGDKNLIPKLLYDRWDSKSEAEAFAKRLAKRNNGTYVGEDGMFAKGGKVEKKGNEMIIGGLAGILLGIFLNK